MEVGEIKSGNEIGRHTGTKEGFTKYIWLECPKCKERRWVTTYLFKKNGNTLCQVCNGRRNGKVNAKLWGKG